MTSTYMTALLVILWSPGVVSIGRHAIQARQWGARTNEHPKPPTADCELVTPDNLRLLRTAESMETRTLSLRRACRASSLHSMLYTALSAQQKTMWNSEGIRLGHIPDMARKLVSGTFEGLAEYLAGQDCGDEAVRQCFVKMFTTVWLCWPLVNE